MVLNGVAEGERSNIKAFLHHARLLNRAPFLDVHAADHCNLGCAGCLHYAPVAPRNLLDPGKYERDLAALAPVPGVQAYFAAVVLMGGEPLLNPDLPEIIRITRRYFPDTEIGLSTNGLLLRRMSDEFWQASRDAGVKLRISAYPIGIDYEALLVLGRENDVDTEYSAYVTGNGRGKQVFWRHRLDPQGRCSAAHSWTICRMDYTLQLRDVALFPCNRGAYMDVLNDAFGTEFIHQPGDFINISDLKSADDLDSFRRRPHPMCRYCDNDASCVTDWERTRRDPHEWINPSLADNLSCYCDDSDLPG